MLFAEPPRSSYDVYFSIFGIRVRVHPFFWLVGLVLGHNAGTMTGVLVWIAALFVAILIHELGHALVMRRFGLRPWVTLYGMGGVTSYDPSQLAYSRANTWIRQILISLAGVGAGFVLVAVLIGVGLVLGYTFMMFVGMETGLLVQLGVNGPNVVTIAHDTQLAGFYVFLNGIPAVWVSNFVNDLLYICFVWGLVNLLPVYPLDGGHVSREVFLRFNPREGIRWSLIFSTVTSGSLAAFAVATIIRNARLIAEAGGRPGEALSSASPFIAMLFGYLAYSSYATLQAYEAGRRQW